MKRRIILISIILGLFVFFALNVNAEEQRKGESITITTYYPSPYGVYKTLKTSELILKPLDAAPAEPVEGMLFFSNGEGKDDEGNKIVKGVWVYADNYWYPLMILEKIIRKE